MIWSQWHWTLYEKLWETWITCQNKLDQKRNGQGKRWCTSQVGMSEKQHTHLLVSTIAAWKYSFAFHFQLLQWCWPEMHWSTTTQFFVFTSQAIQPKMLLMICKGFNKHSLARFSQIPKKMIWNLFVHFFATDYKFRPCVSRSQHQGNDFLHSVQIGESIQPADVDS